MLKHGDAARSRGYLSVQLLNFPVMPVQNVYLPYFLDQRPRLLLISDFSQCSHYLRAATITEVHALVMNYVIIIFLLYSACIAPHACDHAYLDIVTFLLFCQLSELFVEMNCIVKPMTSTKQGLHTCTCICT